jgi:hypothetical protein
MRLTRNTTAVLLVMPALLLIGWFVLEQLPGWLAPPPPWLRYPDLVALPGGCEAALALANAGVERTNSTPSDDTPATVMDAQFPQMMTEVLAPPQGVRFGDGGEGWFSLIAMPREDDQALTRGAVVLLNLDGTPRDIIHLIGGDSTRGERCGDFAPQPRGLRAQLRPYLPLIALGGYLGLIGVGVTGWHMFTRKRNTLRNGEKR